MEDVMVEMNDIAIEPEVVDEATESFEFDGQKGLAIAGGAAAAALVGFAVAKLVKANKDGKFDIHPAVEFAKAHPVWRLSLQWHKLFNIQ